jgi:hypothetical protein
MTTQHVKRHSSTALVIREIQIKTTKRYYYTLMRITKIIQIHQTKHWRDYGTMRTSIQCWREFSEVIITLKNSLFPYNTHSRSKKVLLSTISAFSLTN